MPNDNPHDKPKPPAIAPTKAERRARNRRKLALMSWNDACMSLIKVTRDYPEEIRDAVGEPRVKALIAAATEAFVPEKE